MGIGTALDDNSARPWWAELKRLYLQTSSDLVRDRLTEAQSAHV